MTENDELQFSIDASAKPITMDVESQVTGPDISIGFDGIVGGDLDEALKYISSDGDCEPYYIMFVHIGLLQRRVEKLESELRDVRTG